MVDTRGRLEVRQSPGEMLKLLVLGVAMTALSGALALPSVSGIAIAPPGSIFAIAVGWIGLVFFGFCLGMIAWRAATTRGPVVSLSPEGILDKRLAEDRIPWSAIRGISTWQCNGQRIMILDVQPETEASLRLSAITRMTRGANATLGADGLAVTTQGLSLGYDDLLAASEAYLRAHGRGADV